MSILSHLGIGLESKEHKYHEALVNVMLAISMGILGTFSIIHLFYDEYLMSSIQFVLCVLYAVAYFDPFKRVTRRFKENTVVLGTIILFWFLLVDGGIAKTGIYWVPFFPFMLFAVSGIQRGLRWIVLFAAGFGAILTLDANDILETPYSADEMMFFSFAFFFYVVVSMIFEALRTRQQTEVEEKNDKLLKLKDILNETLETLELEVDKRTSELKKSNQKLELEIKSHEATNQELRESEQKFFQAQKMEALGTLVGGVAHDFNSVLSSINANLFLLQRKIKNQPEVQDALDDIEKMVFHAGEMTKQLLTYARKDNVEKTQYNLSLFMNEGIKLVKATLPSRIKLHTEVAKTPLPILGNTTQLQQILMNLVNNAREALSNIEFPEIRIFIAPLSEAQKVRSKHPVEGEAWAYISVQDNGIGIPEENLNHIFDPFFTTKKTGEGTGLGLAMSYGAIKSHDGIIDVESEINQGTTFHIYIPLMKKDKLESIEYSLDRAFKGKGETILLVDDDQSLCQAQKGALENLGYKVVVAFDGYEAIKRYAEHPVDVVMMDIMMPEMGGIKAAQHILTMDDQAKIFFASGYDKDSSTERFLTSDFAQAEHIRRLNKPFTIQQLCQAIRLELDK